jgi:hypothetical protein
MPDQTPPADELAAVRAEIKRLQDRESDLRSILIASPDARTGNAWAAEIKVIKSQRTDLKELRAAYPKLVDEFTYPIETTRVDLAVITKDGELVRPAGRRA